MLVLQKSYLSFEWGYISFPFKTQHKEQQKLRTSGDTQVNKLNFTREIKQENLEKKLESHSVTLMKICILRFFSSLLSVGFKCTKKRDAVHTVELNYEYYIQFTAIRHRRMKMNNRT